MCIYIQKGIHVYIFTKGHTCVYIYIQKGIYVYIYICTKGCVPQNFAHVHIQHLRLNQDQKETNVLLHC